MLRALYRVSTGIQPSLRIPKWSPLPSPVSPRWLRVGSCTFAIFPSVDCWPWFVAAFERLFRSRSLCYSLGCIMRLLGLRPRSVWGWGGAGREGGGGEGPHTQQKRSQLAGSFFLFLFYIFSFCQSSFPFWFCVRFFFPSCRCACPSPHPTSPPPAHPGHLTALPPRRTHICTVPNRLYSEIVHLFSSNGGGRGSPASPPPPHRPQARYSLHTIL